MNDRHPPRWAEALLRAVLPPKDRDTVSGDLLEEYRESALAERGAVCAQLWYVRQVMSFVNLTALGRVASPFQWAGIVALIQYIFLVLVPRAFGVMLELSLFVPVAVALAVMGAASIRSSREVYFLARLIALWGFVFSAVLLSKMFLDALAPAELGIGVAIAFLAPAIWAAWRTGQVRMGILAVMGASLFGCLLVIGAVTGFAHLGIFGNHPPVDLNFVLLALACGVIVGTMGAMLAKGVGTLVRGPVLE
jgi:hypothetical protein